MGKATFVLSILGIILGTPGIATSAILLDTLKGHRKLYALGAFLVSGLIFCASLWRLGDVADTIH